MAASQENIYADPSDPTKFFQQEDSTVKVRQHLHTMHAAAVLQAIMLALQMISV